MCYDLYSGITVLSENLCCFLVVVGSECLSPNEDLSGSREVTLCPDGCDIWKRDGLITLLLVCIAHLRDGIGVV